MHVEREAAAESLFQRSLPGVEVRLLGVVEIGPLNIVRIRPDSGYTVDQIERSAEIEFHAAGTNVSRLQYQRSS